MRCQMRSLVIVISMTVVIAGAYRDKRDVVSFNTDVMPYHRSRSRNVFLEQPFIDKMIGQQTPPDVPIRDQIISQQDLRDISFKEQSIYPPIHNHQPFKQSLFHMVTTSRDEPLFRDAVLKNRESRGEGENLFRDSPFEGQSAPLASEGQASAYRSRAPFKKQLFTTEASFKNLFRGQSPSGEQASFQKQESFVEFPRIPNPMKFYREDSYNKPIDSYGRQKNAQTQTYEGPSMYMEYDNHALELSTVPVVSSSKHVLPLRDEMPVTSTSAPITTSSLSSSITGVYSSEDFRMKLGSAPMLKSATSSGKCDTLVDSSSITSSDAVTTVPSISVRTNQSSAVDHALTSLTTKPNSAVMATVVPNAEDNNLGPINFHATKYGAVMTPYTTRDDLKSNVYTHLLPKTLESLKFDDFKYLTPETPKNDMKTDIQGSMLNYILSEEHKSRPRDDIQNSFANYALPQHSTVLKHSWPLPRFSQPETSSSYTPLSANGKMRYILPSIPIAPASTISWPTEIKRDVSVMLPPTKSVISSDGVTINNLPLGMNLPLDFIASVPNSLTSSIPNSISESITGGISTSIPGGMTADMPVSIPTLNLGQSLHRAEQLRQTQEARNPWYPTGILANTLSLQLQLGGFGGINYMLHTSNPARPMELGITKAGFILPKLLQPHAPAFAKIG